MQLELKAGQGGRKAGRGGPDRQDGEGQSSLTREALGTVLIPMEVMVLVPSREGQGKATGCDSGGTQLASHGCGELQAIGRVLATQVDGELKRFSIAFPVLQLHSQAAAAVPQNQVHLLQAQPELSYSRKGQGVRWGPTSTASPPSVPLALWQYPPWGSPKPAL